MTMTAIKSVRHYACTDGQCFADRREATRHQAILDLRDWLAIAIEPDQAATVIEQIEADVEGFRDLVRPIIRRRRRGSGEEVQPQMQVETVLNPEVSIEETRAWIDMPDLRGPPFAFGA
jgi:hypothetical protein